ncbi:MAG: hypothetical protein GTO51_05255 [Candidatus Latescibacteria bacterium]|nr:hypothetical protein [Candidatus Latescibacterota bacterium]NIO28410.1 hypothetical protein [Candidatus Latescibacterota bacterium]NIO55959.1 hypothetical protein [Candidatus Latescibacterota bacterium]NIT01923.1 hypothetical protein [Candidatus Latescibacterota bacterium]
MLADLYKKEGILLGVAMGIEYPEYFSDPGAEYAALTMRAALIDLTHWGVLRVSGKDRIRFLNAMLTNDVASLPQGQACRSALATVKGKLVAEIVAIPRGNDVFLFVVQGDTKAVRDILERHIIMDDVALANESGALGILGVEGPKASEVLLRLLSKEALPSERFRFIECQFEKANILILNNTVTGEAGHHLLIPAGELKRIREFLIQSGRACDMACLGRIAWNMRRAENGIPWFGVDVSDNNFPLEVRMDDVVNYAKGCFIGQEPLARIRHRGRVNRHLVGLVPDGALPDEVRTRFPIFDGKTAESFDVRIERLAGTPIDSLDLNGFFPAGAELFAAEPAEFTMDNAASGASVKERKCVGWITSSVFSPKLGNPLLLGHLKREFTEPGTSLILRANDQEFKIKVTTLPVE